MKLLRHFGGILTTGLVFVGYAVALLLALLGAFVLTTIVFTAIVGTFAQLVFGVIE